MPNSIRGHCDVYLPTRFLTKKWPLPIALERLHVRLSIAIPTRSCHPSRQVGLRLDTTSKVYARIPIGQTTSNFHHRWYAYPNFSRVQFIVEFFPSCSRIDSILSIPNLYLSFCSCVLKIVWSTFGSISIFYIVEERVRLSVPQRQAHCWLHQEFLVGNAPNEIWSM